MNKLKVCILAIAMAFSFNMGTVCAKDNVVTFGSYEQDGNLKNGPEPLEWYAIDAPDGTKTMLVCKNIISYSHSFTGPWQDSGARRWLNADFYSKAFTASEKNRIVPTTNATDATSYTLPDILGERVQMNVQRDSSVQDNVFVLSKKGVEVNLLDRDAKKAIATPYAQYESAYAIWEAYGKMDAEPKVSDYSYTEGSFGTRDAGAARKDGYDTNAWVIVTGGSLCIFYGSTPFTGVGIRPCLYISK